MSILQKKKLQLNKGLEGSNGTVLTMHTQSHRPGRMKLTMQCGRGMEERVEWRAGAERRQAAKFWSRTRQRRRTLCSREGGWHGGVEPGDTFSLVSFQNLLRSPQGDAIELDQPHMEAIDLHESIIGILFLSQKKKSIISEFYRYFIWSFVIYFFT